MTENLSAEAKTALVDVGTNRRGATISNRTPAAVVDELHQAGLIGGGLGLTRRGTIARDRLMTAALADAF